MTYLMLRATLAGAALFSGALLAQAQSVPPIDAPAQMAPAPDDQGGPADLPTTPGVPEPDDDSDGG
ncbi:hypothetical protein MJC1_01908 [Methylocystis sp. MJC1]|jgi:hypothetical protein|nr:hypothetical protein MJC1_01908 [Methylocystis sp. MJC1]